MSIRFLADADFDFTLVQRVRRREPAIDFKSANEADLEGLADSEVLELAAIESRLLVSHDTSTMPIHFAERLRSGRNSPGVLLSSQNAPHDEIVESLLTIWLASDASEWSNQIIYLPALTRHVFKRL